jgi:hypothetical protein
MKMAMSGRTNLRLKAGGKRVGGACVRKEVSLRRLTVKEFIVASQNEWANSALNRLKLLHLWSALCSYYADEVRDFGAIPKGESVEVDKQELELALGLLRRPATPKLSRRVEPAFFSA